MQCFERHFSNSHNTEQTMWCHGCGDPWPLHTAARSLAVVVAAVTDKESLPNARLLVPRYIGLRVEPEFTGSTAVIRSSMYIHYVMNFRKLIKQTKNMTHIHIQTSKFLKFSLPMCSVMCLFLLLGSVLSGQPLTGQIQPAPSGAI